MSPSTLLATALVLTGASALPRRATTTAPTYLVTFGDSYSQTGFNVSLSPPTPDSPLGNPALPGWTSSGGLNWVGQLASRAVSNGRDAPVLSYNFADGGATTDGRLIPSYIPTVHSFVDQVAIFQQTLAADPRPDGWARWAADDTLFGVWLGVNDVGVANGWDNATEVFGLVMERYFGNLNALYDAGARNIAILTVPPTQRTPLFISEAPKPAVVPAIKFYTDSIRSNLASWMTTHADADVRVVDTQVPFNQALDNPAEYNAPDALCYGPPGTAEGGKSCLWNNDYHPGVEIQKLVARAVADAWQDKFF